MPRKARVDIPGQLYHITARVVDRCQLFLDDQDRESFLSRFSTLLIDTDTRCLAWALMSSHIHLLLRPGSAGLATFMRRLLTGHAVAFNQRHRRVGHLFQNRYHSILCEEDSYLLPLIRYIHLNPLQAGITPDLETLDCFPWCGHAVLMGNRRLAGQQMGEVLAYFGKKEKQSRRRYRGFLADGVDSSRKAGSPAIGKQDLIRSLGFETGSCCDDDQVLGSHSFAEKILSEETEKSSARIGLQELMEKVAQEFSTTIVDLRSRNRTKDLSDARALICHLAISYLKIPGAEVARQLGQVRSSVTRAVRRGAELVEGKTDWIKTLLKT
jgi:REP element-mobilizing transposase RayT